MVCKVRSKMTEKALKLFLNIHKSYYKHFHCLDLLLPHEVTVQHENISLVKMKLCCLCETSIISSKIKASTVCFNLFDEPMGFLMILWSFNFIKLYRKTHLLVLCGLCMQTVYCVTFHSLVWDHCLTDLGVTAYFPTWWHFNCLPLQVSVSSVCDWSVKVKH